MTQSHGVFQPEAAIRDALYGDIEVAGLFREVLDTAPMQRLRRIQQLGLAYLICPGATHTRFAHSVGVYHLMTKAVRHLKRHPRWEEVPPLDGDLLRMAALTHDTQHYPAAHFVEEVGLAWACHETAASSVFENGDLADAVRRLHPDAPRRIPALIRHDDPSPLANLLSSGIDVDKLDYLARDLAHTGYPTMVDQDGILRHLTLVTSPDTGRLVVGLHEAAIPSWESMLFAKYYLYRQVLFADAVRAATAMMRALVLLAMEAELLAREELMGGTDLELLGILRARLLRRRSGTPVHRVLGRLLDGVTDRHLYRPALRLPVRLVPRLTPDQLIAAEKALAAHLGLVHGEVLLDLPHRPRMLDMDVWVELTDGSVRHAASLGTDGGMAIQHLAQAAYHASSRALVLTAVPVSLEDATFWEVLAGCGISPDGGGDATASSGPHHHDDS